MLIRSLACTALLATTFTAHATDYPLQVQNCGHTVTFDKAPASAVTIGQGGTEMLYALGLGDKVAGTALWFNRCCRSSRPSTTRRRACPTTFPASSR
jgi:iron complex transport system substrate-binding protein